MSVSVDPSCAWYLQSPREVSHLKLELHMAVAMLWVLRAQPRSSARGANWEQMLGLLKPETYLLQGQTP